MRKNTAKILRIVFAVLGFAGMLCFFAIAVRLYSPSATETGEFPAEWAVVFALVAVPGWLISTILHPLFHELGHISFGKAVKMDLLSVQIGKWRLVHAAKWQMSREKGWQTGGSCVMLSSGSEKAKKKLFLYTLGGPVGSLVYILLNFLFLLFAPAMPYFFYAFFSAGVCSGFFELLSNLIPSDGAEDTDGSVLFGLITNTDVSRVRLAVFQAQCEIYGGTSPKDLGEELFSQPVVMESEPAFAALLSVQALAFLDKGDFPSYHKAVSRLATLTPFLDREGRFAAETEALYSAALRKDEKAFSAYAETFSALKEVKTAAAYRVRTACEMYFKKNLSVAHVCAVRGLQAAADALPGERNMEVRLLNALTSDLNRMTAEEIEMAAVSHEDDETNE